MFPKFNLSRFSSLAALGIMVAVLGGCAETTGGSGPSVPATAAREEFIRTRFESPVPRNPITTAVPAESISSSRKLASHYGSRNVAAH